MRGVDLRNIINVLCYTSYITFFKDTNVVSEPHELLQFSLNRFGDGRKMTRRHYHSSPRMEL